MRTLFHFIEPVTTAALIGAGASLLASGANQYAGSVKNRKGRKWAAEQSTLEWERKMDAWQQMNEYNSPSAQMERLREAGLNPHLMYQQGNVGNATSLPAVQEQKSGGYEHYQQDWNAFQAYQNIKQQKVQIDNLEKIGEGVELQNKNRNLDNQIKQKVVDYLPEKWQYQTEAWLLANKHKTAQIGNVVAQMDKATQDAIWMGFKNEYWTKYRINIDNDKVWMRLGYTTVVDKLNALFEAAQGDKETLFKLKQMEGEDSIPLTGTQD